MRGRSGGELRLRTILKNKIRNLSFVILGYANLCFVISVYAKPVTHSGLESFFLSHKLLFFFNSATGGLAREQAQVGARACMT